MGPYRLTQRLGNIISTTMVGVDERAKMGLELEYSELATLPGREATLTWALMANLVKALAIIINFFFFFFFQEKSESYVEFIGCTSS